MELERKDGRTSKSWGQSGEMMTFEILIVIILLVVAYFLFFRSNEPVSEIQDISEEPTSESESDISSQIGSRTSGETTVPKTNPIEEVQTNPFSDYKNPFE